MQFLGAPHRMNVLRPTLKNQGTEQRMPTRPERMAEHLQNVLL